MQPIMKAAMINEELIRLRSRPPLGRGFVSSQKAKVTAGTLFLMMLRRLVHVAMFIAADDRAIFIAASPVLIAKVPFIASTRAGARSKLATARYARLP